MKASRIRTALLGSGAAIALMAGAAPASADEISNLRSQIEEMQNRVAQIEADRAEDRRVVSAAAVEAGDKPRSWKLPGTNTSMNVGGYAKLDIIYNINAPNQVAGLTPGDSIVVWALPPEGTAGANRQNNFRFHARQSRLWVRTWTPTDWGELATHIEGDFFGTQALSPSNANEFRLRHAYGRLGPVLGGQTWTTFMPLYSLPEVLDFSGPTGDIFVRQAQLRYTHNFGGGWQMQAAIEDPFAGQAGPASIYSIGGAPPAAGPGALTRNPRYPDIILNIAKGYTMWGRGRAGAGIIIRDLQYDTGVPGISDSEVGWGGYLAIGHAFNDRFRVGAQGTIGRGIGKYLLLSSGTPDIVATLNPGSGTLNVEPVFHVGGFLWARYAWTDNIRSTLSYGYTHNDPGSADNVTNLQLVGVGLAGAAPVQTQTLHANLIWSPVPQTNIGVEYIWYHVNYLNANNAKNHRIQVSFQYRF